MLEGLRTRLGRLVLVGDSLYGLVGESVGVPLERKGEDDCSRLVGGLGVLRLSSKGISCIAGGEDNGGASEERREVGYAIGRLPSAGGIGGAREDRRDFARMLSSSWLKNGSGSIGSI